MSARSHRGDEFSPTPHLTLYEVGGEPVELSAIADGGSWEGAEVLGGGWYAAGLHEQGVVLLQEVAGELVERARLAEGLDNVWDLFLAAEGELWVADGSGVARLDVTDPTAPRLVARAPLAGSVKDLRVAGERVAASAGAEGVHLLDRTTLAPLGLVPTPGSAVGATFSDDALVVADWSEARVYDVSDPQTPRLVTTERIDPRFTPAPIARVLTVGADGAEVFLGEWSAGIFRAELRADRPAPDLRWEGRTLEFPKAALGEEVALALVFENEGAEPLAISRLEASPPFRALASELTVPTDGAAFVELRYTTETLDVVNGTLELLTDDPDECTVSIPLVANEDDLGVGDVFPDFTIDDLQSGEPLTLSSLEGEVVLLSYFATF